jgi:hypothetical protein
MTHKTWHILGLPLSLILLQNHLYIQGPSWSWWYCRLDLQIHMQSVHITTKVVSSIPTHGEVYSILYILAIKVCQWPPTGGWFSLGSPVSSTNKTDHHDISDKLLKVVLNTITMTLPNINTYTQSVSYDDKNTRTNLWCTCFIQVIFVFQ